MDFDFIDEMPPEAKEAQADEIIDLVEVAKNIPLLHWQYTDPNYTDGAEDHLGLITQSLLKVPGLASAVSTDENGVQNFDSRHIAAAALSLVAALARKVLGVDLQDNYAADEEEVNDELRQDVDTEIPATDTTTVTE